MASTFAVLVVVFTFCTAPCLSQLNSLLLSSLFGEMEFEGPFENGGFDPFGHAAMSLNQLNRRLLALERNVRTGAFGGCESGIIGPFTQTMRTGHINFRGHFLTPPTVSLSLSDVIVSNASRPINFQIRPSTMTNTMAGVTFTDNTENLGAAFVSYMACPSNGNTPVRA